MSGCVEQRDDLTCYALGLLDEPDNLRFEAHLADCDGCARELEDILHTVEDLAMVSQDRDALAEVAATLDPRSRLIRDARSERPSRLPEREVGPAKPGRRPVRTLRPRTRPDSRRRRRAPAVLTAIAAAVLASVGLAIVLIGPGSGGQNTARASESAPAIQPTPTIGTSGASRYQNTDPGTGVHLDVLVAAQPYGSRLSVTLSKVSGPRHCRLVTVDTHGTVEAVASWLVPAAGYGTSAHPAPLEVPAVSSLAPTQIARVEVQELDQLNRPTVLVAVPLR